MIDVSAPSAVIKRWGNSATANQDGRVRVALCCEASGLLFILMCEEFRKIASGRRRDFWRQRQVWMGMLAFGGD